MLRKLHTSAVSARLPELRSPSAARRPGGSRGAPGGNIATVVGIWDTALPYVVLASLNIGSANDITVVALREAERVDLPRYDRVDTLFDEIEADMDA
jgi:hypothetical protein